MKHKLIDCARCGSPVLEDHRGPTCTVYTGMLKCHKEAVARLVHPDGSLNPGGNVCLKHGLDIVAEYAAKLHETWTLQEITPAQV